MATGGNRTEANTSSPGDYELAIDSQVKSFVEIKQKLTYFLITASVAVIGFDASFVTTNLRSGGAFTLTFLESRAIILSCIAGLLTAGLSLLNLALEHQSYSRHLGYRYRRQTWDSLSTAQQASWDNLTRWASRLLKGAFAALFTQIALTVVFFVRYFW